MKKYPITEWFWIDEDLRIKAIKTTQSDFWYVRYNLPGVGQQKKSLKTKSKKQARLNGYAFAREFAAGKIEQRGQSAPTVGEIITARCNRLRTIGRSPETLTQYERVYAQLMARLPRGADTKLSALTPSVLESLEDAWRKTGIPVPNRPTNRRGGRKARPMGPTTVKNTMLTVKALVHFALKRGLIDRDPAVSYEMPTAQFKEIEIFSSHELALIYADPDKTQADYWRFFTHACLRSKEFCWLLKTDVILNEAGHPSAIQIRKKVCPYTGRKWCPKYGIERVVPLTTEAADIVAGAMASSKVAWVFEAPDTTGPQQGMWSPGRVLKKLDARLEACGITHGYTHIFRHTGATYLANDARMPIVHLQKFLGHKNIQTTMRYLHPKAQDVAASLNQVDFSKLTPPPPVPPVPPVNTVPVVTPLAANTPTAATQTTTDMANNKGSAAMKIIKPASGKEDKRKAG